MYLSKISAFLTVSLDDESGVGEAETVGVAVGAEISDEIAVAVANGVQALIIKMISDRISGKVFFIVFYLQEIRLMTGK